MQSDDDEPTPTQPGTPQTAAQIRRLIRFSIGDDYPLLALLVDLEMALRAEARAARLAEVRAAVERSGALHFTRAAVLAILSDTPETP